MPQRRTRSTPEGENAFQPIADRIVLLRKRKGWTQLELAEKLGLSRDLVASVESGRTNINATSLVQWATVLEVSTDHLLGVDVKESPTGMFVPEKFLSIKLMRRMLEIAQMPSQKQAALLRVIDMYVVGTKWEHMETNTIATKVEYVKNLDDVKSSMSEGPKPVSSPLGEPPSSE